MAEKEERIAVAKMIVNTDEEGSAQLDHFKIYSRQEAIEKMAKAICNMGDEKTWGRVDENYKHYCTAQAEWALNALLGDEECQKK